VNQLRLLMLEELHRRNFADTTPSACAGVLASREPAPIFHK
jgi:hypothetical protein